MGGLIAFRCCNFDNTAEREQFRILCKMLKERYAYADDYCLFIANYNIFDCEFDAILIKNDAIIAVEFKNYGGKIIATENGDWKADGVIVKGGSKKTVYQQARVNHVALRKGLNELGVNSNWTKDIPSLIIFNQPITIDNHLSGKVKSWLHITDNEHFIEKVNDITCKSTDMSNLDIINLAISLNLSSFIDEELSTFKISNNPLPPNNIIDNYSTPYNSTDNDENNIDLEVEKKLLFETLISYSRFTPNHISNLKPHQIFVFGTDTHGSQRFGAAGMACNKFGAQVGVVEGPTGACYALPTKSFKFVHFKEAVKRFKDYVINNKQYVFLITPVGCGHANFNVDEVACLFRDFVFYENVMLPKIFIERLLSLNEDSHE